MPTTLTRSRSAVLPLLLIALAATLLLPACKTGAVVSSGNAEAPVIPPSVLGPEDVISVRVYLEESLTGDYQVDADGEIAYPLLGTMLVSGMKPSQVALQIRDGLADGYLNDPQVSVTVAEFNSRKVSVIGEVNKPGRYPYREGMTLVQAIADAGGTTESAALGTVQVTRRAAEAQQFEVPFRDITLGRTPDFALVPGDVVFVQESAVK